MKKGLLLSVVASGFIFAGGNIAPVQPVVPAAAPAACDFWGSVGFRYDAIDAELRDDTGAVVASTDFSDSDSNLAKFYVDLGVEKELGYGFGFGAELAGMVNTDGKFKHRHENGEISQLYVTYKNGGTAIKVGRQALPKAVSPWAWSDTTVGVYDNTFNGITVVNTSAIANTTLVGAWVHSIADNNNNTKIADDKGLFMLGAIYSGISNTTLSTSAYFKPKGKLDGVGEIGKAYSVWAAGTTKVDNIDLGLQLAYAKVKNLKSTFGVAAYAGTTYNDFDLKLTAAYINDGASPLNLGGTSGFWGNVGYANVDFGGGASISDVVAGNPIAISKQTIVKLDAGYKLPYGKLFAGVAYDKYSDSVVDKAIAGRVGYSFKVSGVNAKVEYRYTKIDADTTKASIKAQKIRVEGIYKF